MRDTYLAFVFFNQIRNDLSKDSFYCTNNKRLDVGYLLSKHIVSSDVLNFEKTPEQVFQYQLLQLPRFQT